MNMILRKIIISAIRFSVKPFYDRRYLRGRYFDKALTGWRWTLNGILTQKILGYNRRVPWPVSPFVTLSNWKNITFHPDDINNFQSPGCYFQNFSAHIYIGRGSYIAPNVGLITANHNPNELSSHDLGADITIGSNSWIGMNSVILPGVVLGDRTIVGAGSVVTKSFPEGNCVVAGVPAKKIRDI